MFAPQQTEGHMLLGAFAFMFSELLCAVGEGARAAGTCVGVRCWPGRAHGQERQPTPRATAATQRAVSVGRGALGLQCWTQAEASPPAFLLSPVVTRGQDHPGPVSSPRPQLFWSSLHQTPGCELPVQLWFSLLAPMLQLPSAAPSPVSRGVLGPSSQQP